MNMNPNESTEDDAVTFRSRLGSVALPAILLTIVIYLILKFAHPADDSVIARYPFGFAALVGLGIFLFRVLTSYLRTGIRVEAHGIRDLSNGVTLAWNEIEEVKIEERKDQSGKIMLRVAVLKGAKKRIRFGDFHGVVLPRDPGVLDTSCAGLLMAIVAARTGSEVLYPENWEVVPEAQATSTEAGVGPPEAGAGEGEFGSTRRQGMLAMGVAALLKIGPKALKIIISLAKTVKPGAALVTAAAYSLIFSWKFAVALIVLIVVHECGHVYAMWRTGMKVKGIYLIPFVGGVAYGRGSVKSRWDGAYIAINGPVWGTALTLVLLGGYLITGIGMLGAMAAWGALINLFNLLPIMPLDGGRLINSIAFSSGHTIGAPVTFCSLVLGGGLAYVGGLELLILVVFFGLMEFGSQLGASPVRRGLALLGGRSLVGDQHEHFASLVAPVHANPKDVRARAQQRREEWTMRRQEAMQQPMSPRQLMLVIAGWIILAAVLIAVMWKMTNIPGAGNPMEFLE